MNKSIMRTWRSLVCFQVLQELMCISSCKLFFSLTTRFTEALDCNHRVVVSPPQLAHSRLDLWFQKLRQCSQVSGAQCFWKSIQLLQDWLPSTVQEQVFTKGYLCWTVQFLGMHSFLQYAISCSPSNYICISFCSACRRAHMLLPQTLSASTSQHLTHWPSILV